MAGHHWFQQLTVWRAGADGRRGERVVSEKARRKPERTLEVDADGQRFSIKPHSHEATQYRLLRAVFATRADASEHVSTRSQGTERSQRTRGNDKANGPKAFGTAHLTGSAARWAPSDESNSD